MDNLGPVQQKVLDSVKEYYKLTHKLITVCSMADYTGMKHIPLRKAMNLLTQKQRLRKIRNIGYSLLV